MGNNVNSIGIGTIIAIILSWSINHSVLWCVLHGVCSWFYVIYYLIKY
jgi:p-aminobenzoyl-glutamate transporter AbgT